MATRHGAFFARLPTDELLPWEAALRQAVLGALDASPPSFPLQEWIDRRIGGEIETKIPNGGFLEVCHQGAALPAAPPPPAFEGARGGGRAANNTAPDISKEAWLASLPKDSFTEAETEMRDAILEFLATWKSPELATMLHLNSHPLVMKKVAKLIPKSATLRDWIEERIGREIEIKVERNQEVLYLCKGTKDVVYEKYMELNARKGPGPPPPGMHSKPPGSGPPPGPPPPRGGGPPMAPRAMGGSNLSPKAFFEMLPSNALTPEEATLRQALLDWLARWPQERPAERPPTIADLGGCIPVRKARETLLPKAVRLQEWVDNRIGGEIELRRVEHGQIEIHIRAAEGSNSQGQGNSNKKRDREQSQEEKKEAFFSTLPSDDFTPEEGTLRELIIQVVKGWRGTSPPTLINIGTDPKVNKARSALLPKGHPVTLKEWIDRRIGGEIECIMENGQTHLAIRGTAPQQGRGGGGAGAKRRRP